MVSCGMHGGGVGGEERGASIVLMEAGRAQMARLGRIGPMQRERESTREAEPSQTKKAEPSQARLHKPARRQARQKKGKKGTHLLLEE